MKKKPLVAKSKVKVFCSEYVSNDNTWFLIENEAEGEVGVTMEFKLEGYKLEGPDEEDGNTWTFRVEPGGNVVKHLEPAKKALGSSGGMGMGFGGMAALLDDYANVANCYSYKASIEE